MVKARFTTEELAVIAARQLTARELVVLFMGVKENEPAIGKKLGITKQRVNQIKKSALRKVYWQLSGHSAESLKVDATSSTGKELW